MRSRIIATVMWSVGLIMPACAANITPLPPGMATKGALVQTWSAFCRDLPTYQPARDVTYQNGVDVYGRPVASADLPTQAKQIAKSPVYRLYITTAQAAQLNIALPNVPHQGDMLISDVMVNSQTGEVAINGQPVAQDRLYQMCSQL